MLKATFSKSSTCDFSCLCLCEFVLFWFLGLISVESFTDLIHLGLAIYAINLSKLGQKVYEGQGKDKIKKKKGNKGPEQGLESFGCYSAVCISLPDDLQENSFLRRALKNPHNLHENSRDELCLCFYPSNGCSQLCQILFFCTPIRIVSHGQTSDHHGLLTNCNAQGKGG